MLQAVGESSIFMYSLAIDCIFSLSAVTVLKFLTRDFHFTVVPENDIAVIPGVMMKEAFV